MSKLLSARFWMALGLTVAFIWGFFSKMIGGEAFTAVMLIVVKDYFQRTDRETSK